MSEPRPTGRDTAAIDKALTLRFGSGLERLKAQGNRVGDRRTGRFMPVDRVLRILRRLTPKEARIADEMLNQIALHANAIGSPLPHPDDDSFDETWFDEMAEIIADALAKGARCAEAISSRVFEALGLATLSTGEAELCAEVAS